MEKYINKLLGISSQSIEEKEKNLIFIDSFAKNNQIAYELKAILEKKNGFYVFENALDFYSNSMIEQISETIVKLYNLKDQLLFFAQDIFGNQFCIQENKIFLFDIETSEREYISETFDEWVKIILENYNYWTGYTIAHEWQKIHGALQKNERLVPKMPFIVGGQYEIENLTKQDLVESLNFRSNLASQIRDISDGEKIQIKISE